ncbi:MAG: hypothetical protein KTR16_16250 [Acidiferrobacterales bacterium]|nr:hypothetical protein [Acidiferrobacterales bacterium]
MLISNIVTRSLQVMLMTLCMLITSPLLSQETESDESISSEQKNPSQSDNTTTNNDNTKSKSKPQENVFKPSEEISEDLPVPFPVDI